MPTFECRSNLDSGGSLLSNRHISSHHRWYKDSHNDSHNRRETPPPPPTAAKGDTPTESIKTLSTWSAKGAPSATIGDATFGRRLPTSPIRGVTLTSTFSGTIAGGLSATTTPPDISLFNVNRPGLLGDIFPVQRAAFVPCLFEPQKPRSETVPIHFPKQSECPLHQYQPALSPSWLVRPLAGPLDRFRRLSDLVAIQRLPTRRPTGLSRVHHRPHPGRLVRSGRGGQPAPARISRSTCIANPGGYPPPPPPPPKSVVVSRPKASRLILGPHCSVLTIPEVKQLTRRQERKNHVHARAPADPMSQPATQKTHHPLFHCLG